MHSISSVWLAGRAWNEAAVRGDLRPEDLGLQRFVYKIK